MGIGKTIDEEYGKNLKSMSLHGNYLKEEEEAALMNLPLSKRWLDIPYLRYETESLLCAAQKKGWLLTTYFQKYRKHRVGLNADYSRYKTRQ